MDNLYRNQANGNKCNNSEDNNNDSTENTDGTNVGKYHKFSSPHIPIT